MNGKVFGDLIATVLGRIDLRCIHVTPGSRHCLMKMAAITLKRDEKLSFISGRIWFPFPVSHHSIKKYLPTTSDDHWPHFMQRI